MRANAREQVTSSDTNQRLVRRIMKHAGNPRISVRLWNGEEFPITDAPSVAVMEIREKSALLRLLRSPSVGFGECYSRGLIEIHGDLLAFTNEVTAAVTRKNFDNVRRPKLRSLIRALRNNSLARSLRNVRHHYDLGNDFYRLWLDDRMVYTCAYYESSAATLEEAQLAKLDHVCRKLQLRPGQEVVEAGCGWGALAMHMAERYGVKVTAYNNSHEQVAFARERVAASGLQDRVTVVEDDYRNIDRRCDVFVSVGMLEHVGIANFATLGDVVIRNLRPEGVGLIHTIGRSFPDTLDPWIAKHIFPGGHVPSLSEMTKVFEPYKMSILDVENLRLHYARTCAAWLENFKSVRAEVEAMYDEEFARMWQLYLAGSSAGFRSGTLQLYQVLFAPQGNNRVPLTRRYQYPDERKPEDRE